MSEQLSTQLEPNQLWIPGANYSIDAEYPTPTTDELRDMWQDYLGPDAAVIPTPGVYGAMRLPDTLPTALISVDACEVLRYTNIDIIRVERSPEDLIKNPIKSIHVYGEDCTYQDNYADIQALAQVLIDGDHIRPIENIDQIHDLLQRWQRLGAYTVLNTSTLPGSEPGTIRFLKRFLPGSFDALLLPRNHDSDASMATKGDVAASLTLTLENTVFGDKVPSTHLERDLTAIHIDDKPCHNTVFRERMVAIGASAYTLRPMYPSHLKADKQSIDTLTPLAAFQMADVILHAEMAPPATNSQVY